MTLFEFLVPDESVSFHDKILKVKINYTSCNSGDIVSNTIKYQHGTIKKTGTQTVINKGASMINELSRGPILTMSLKRSSLLLAVDAYVIHGLLCIHFVGILRFLSRRIWLVYSWQFYSICAVQNERINWRELEEIIIRDFRNLFWTGLSNGRKLMREINVKSIFSYSNMWTKVKLKFISNRSSRKN